MLEKVTPPQSRAGGQEQCWKSSPEHLGSSSRLKKLIDCPPLTGQDVVRLYLKTNTIIGSAKTMPTKYIERKLAERVVVLLRSVGEVAEVLVAVNPAIRLGKFVLMLREIPVAVLVVRAGMKVAVMDQRTDKAGCRVA